MNILNQITKKIKLNNKYTIPILCIVEIPKNIYNNTTQSYHPGFVYSSSTFNQEQDNMLTTYKIDNIIANNLIIRFIDFINLFHINEDIILSICKRNEYIISNILLNQKNAYNISNFDKYILQNKPIKFICNKLNEQLNNLLNTQNSNITNFILYMSFLMNEIKNKNNYTEQIYTELNMLPISCIFYNISNKIESFIIVKNKNIIDNEHLFLNKNEISNLYTFINKKNINLVLNEIDLPIFFGLYNTRSLIILLQSLTINLYKIRSKFNQYAIIISSSIYLYIIKNKYFFLKTLIKASVYIDIDNLDKNIFHFMNTMQNQNIMCILFCITKEDKKICTHLTYIAEYYNKKIIFYEINHEHIE